MTSTFRATLFSSLSSLGLLAVTSPALAQAPATTPLETAPADAAPPADAPATQATTPVADPPPPSDTPPAPAPEPTATVAVVEPSPEPVVVAVVAEPAAPEPSLSPLKIGTSTFSRFEYRQNYDELGVSRPRFTEGDNTVFRARLTFQTAELDLAGIKGSIYFAPQASGSWGMSGTGGTVGEANVGIYEGYFKLAGEHLAFKAGRFAMNYGEALVIGNLDWHQSGRAFDGAHLSAKAGKVTVDAFFTQTAEGWPAQGQPFFAGDSFFWGAYGMFGPAITEGLDLDAYALARTWGASNTTTDDGMGGTVTTHRDAATFVTIGARAKQKLGVFDYRAEADLQLGKNQNAAGGDSLNKLAYQGDLELGIAPSEAFRIALGGAFASGNKSDTADKDEAYDELFPTTHKWLGLMDVIGLRTNVAAAILKTQINFTKTFGLSVDGHVFWRPEDGGLGRVNNDNSLAGFEIDAGLAKKLGKYALVRGLYGIFIPGQDHYASNVAAHYVEVEAGLRF